MTIRESPISTFHRACGDSKARGEFVGSSAQKSELLRASISLAASWHLVRLFIQGCRARLTGRAANRMPGENCPGSALTNPNGRGRQYRSLHRGISSDCSSRYQKHARQGARLLETQQQSLGLSTKISNFADVNNAQSFVASPPIVSARLKIRWAAVRRILNARGDCPSPALRTDASNSREYSRCNFDCSFTFRCF